MPQPRMIIEGDNCPEPNVDGEWREYYRQAAKTKKKTPHRTPVQVNPFTLLLVFYFVGVPTLALVGYLRGGALPIFLLTLGIVGFWGLVTAAILGGNK